MQIDETDKIIFTFPVLYEGWECDSEAWVMEKSDGTRYLKMTSHGGEYIGDLSELEERCAEYTRVLNETQKAMNMLIVKA